MAAARLGRPAPTNSGPHRRPCGLHQIRPTKLAPPRSTAADRSSSSTTTTSSSSQSSSTLVKPSVGVICITDLAAPGSTGAARQAEALITANDLVAREFYPANQKSPIADALAFNGYRLRHAAQNLGLHMREGARGAHATLLAVADTTTTTTTTTISSSSSSRDQMQQQPPRRASWGLFPGGSGGSSSSSWEGSELGGEPVGVCNVTLRWAGDGIAAAAGCLPGSPFAMVTNMTVAPEWRRRGVARQLMESCLVTSSCRLSEAPHFVALLCYRGYSPAYNLYTSFGFIQTNWMDPLWKEDAERARVGKPRRLLLVKPLRDSVRPPPAPSAPVAEEAEQSQERAAAAAAAVAVNRLLG